MKTGEPATCSYVSSRYICLMSVIRVTTPFNIDLEFNVAPFHKRLFAWLTDLVIVYVYVWFVGRYIVAAFAMDSLGDTLTILFLLIPAYLYHLVCEVLMHGQSFGKKLLGIKVIDLSGREASLGQYVIRWSFRLFDMVLTLGAAAVLAAALSKNSQRVGDILAGTVVIDQNAKTSLDETIYIEPEDYNYQPVFKEVLQLSDRDINGIRSLLDAKAGSRDTEIYMEQVAEKIKRVLKIETELSPRELLEQLLKDYNHLT